MTIPPVSVRWVRPCEVCYHCLFDDCICRLDKSGKKNTRQYYSRTNPCKDNIKLKEMQEPIDQHNATQPRTHWRIINDRR